MFAQTMFPTLRMAQTLNLVVKRSVDKSRNDVLKISLGGKLLGTVVDIPCVGVESNSVSMEDRASFVKAFRELGYKNKHEHLIENPEDELVMLSVCADFHNEGVTLKEMKRKAKTKCLWVTTDCVDGQFWEIKGAFDQDMKQAIIVANPAQTITFFINEDIADL
jgi:hypothetical protein